jgi:hypothetical protein
MFTPSKKGTKHGKSPGRKKKVGRNSLEGSPVTAKAEALNWKLKNRKLLLALAGSQGAAYDDGSVMMALRVLMKLIDEAKRGKDAWKRVKGSERARASACWVHTNQHQERGSFDELRGA